MTRTMRLPSRSRGVRLPSGVGLTPTGVDGGYRVAFRGRWPGVVVPYHMGSNRPAGWEWSHIDGRHGWTRTRYEAIAALVRAAMFRP